jgi:hypothetical protein
MLCTQNTLFYLFDIYISKCGCVLQLYYRKISILTSSGVFTFLVSRVEVPEFQGSYLCC